MFNTNIYNRRRNRLDGVLGQEIEGLNTLRMDLAKPVPNQMPTLSQDVQSLRDNLDLLKIDDALSNIEYQQSPLGPVLGKDIRELTSAAADIEPRKRDSVFSYMQGFDAPVNARSEKEGIALALADIANKFSGAYYAREGAESQAIKDEEALAAQHAREDELLDREYGYKSEAERRKIEQEQNKPLSTSELKHIDDSTPESRAAFESSTRQLMQANVPENLAKRQSMALLELSRDGKKEAENVAYELSNAATEVNKRAREGDVLPEELSMYTIANMPSEVSRQLGSSEAGNAQMYNQALNGIIGMAEMEKAGYDPSKISTALISQLKGAGAITEAGLTGIFNLLRNESATEEDQRYLSYQDEMIRAKLRKESGATIGESESAGEVKVYGLDLAKNLIGGNSPEAIKARIENNKNLMRGMSLGLGVATPYAENSNIIVNNLLDEILAERDFQNRSFGSGTNRRIFGNNDESRTYQEIQNMGEIEYNKFFEKLSEEERKEYIKVDMERRLIR